MSEEYVVEKIEKKLNEKTTIKGLLYYDPDAQSPRDGFFDHLGKMICFHKKYILGDKTDLKNDMFSSWEELREYLINEKKAVVILPLFLYDHSGITISTGSFNDRWDSGQVGYIYVDSDTMIKEYGVINEETKEKARNVLLGEVEEYDQYITGEVYYYVVKQVSFCDSCGQEIEENLDSCGGFYGHKYALEELTRAVEVFLKKAVVS